MYQIGELKDQKALDEIKRLYGKKSISYDVFEKDGFFIIMARNESDVRMATDYFRLVIGLPPIHEMPEEWKKIKKTKLGPATLSLCAVSIGVYLLMQLAPNVYRLLSFKLSLLEAWRITTPIFMHFHIIHILFNMLWLYNLGKLIESHFGAGRYLAFVFVTGTISNVCQYAVLGPGFGGMSGVIFAFVGFIWVMRALDPNCEIALPKADIGMMVAWFFICATGLIPNIANTAHGTGLFMGMIASLFANLPARRNIGAKKYAIYSLVSLAILAATFALEFIKLKKFHIDLI